jgi:acyl-CoA thioesterase II
MTRHESSRVPTASDLADAEVEALVALLSPAPIGENRYLAKVRTDDLLTRSYGGQIVAQTLAAAWDTVQPAFLPQSLHGYFVRPGRLGQSLDIGIERVRDGRSFATRRATATQGGKPVFVLNASFHIREPGEEYQIPAPPGVTGPGSAPGVEVEESRLFGAFDVREIIPDQDGDGVHPHEPVRRLWVRTRAPLPDDEPFVHAALLAYISDLRPVIAAYVPIRVPFGVGTFSSLDHAMWFHRPVHMDKWVLIDYHVISNAVSRSLVQGHVYAQDGTLVASFNQEVLVRTGLRAIPPETENPR